MSRGTPALVGTRPAPAAAAAAVSAVRPLTVLFVHQSSDLYGSDRVLLEAAANLNRAGGVAIVALPGDGPLVAALRERGIEVCALAPRLLLKLTRESLAPRALLHLLRALPVALAALDTCVGARRIDLVQTNTLAVLAGALWAWRRGQRHLWHVHEIVERPRLAAWAFPWLVRLLAHRVVCNSHATQRWLVRAQPAILPRLDVVWNGSPDMRRNAQRHDGAPAAGARAASLPVSIGLVGRINRMKGHELLLQAAERLQARGVSGFEIVFIGSPPPGQEQLLLALERRVAASPLAGRVRLTGFLADVAPAYAALDIVCVPSVEPESFGLVAIEAMASERAVVASAIGGLPEIVEHGVTGYLFPAGDVEALAERLAELVASPARRAELGRAGRVRYERDFPQQTMNDRLLASQRACAAHRS